MSTLAKVDFDAAIRSLIEAYGYSYEQLKAECEDAEPWYVQKTDWRDKEGILHDRKGRQKAYRYADCDVEFPIVFYGEDDGYSTSEKQQTDFKAAAKRDCFANGFHDFMKVGFNNLAEDTDEKAAQAAMDYVRDFQHNKLKGKGLLLIGSYGVGKTHLAACICNAVIEMGKRCKMTSIENMTDEHYSVNSALKKLCNYSLVVIDDFGSERDTATSQANTFQVFKRLNEQKIPFIVTSNLTMNQVMRPTTKNERVLDRIKHRGLIVEVHGRNRRDVRGSLF